MCANLSFVMLLETEMLLPPVNDYSQAPEAAGFDACVGRGPNPF